jgi:glucokinase
MGVSDRRFAGIDLGGTEIKAAVVAEGGEVIGRRSSPTLAVEGRDAVMGRIATLVEWARTTYGPDGLSALGVAVPGVLDSQTGRIELVANLTTDWNGYAMADGLERLTGLCPALMNDVRAATLGEATWGAGRDYREFICIAIGTGIGGGVVIDGRILAGSRGAAGEIGHMTQVPDGRPCGCGNRGCLETVAAAPAMMRAAQAAIDAGDAALAAACGGEPTPAALALAARNGSQTATRIYADAGREVGQALGSLVCVLDPQAVIVGGGVAQAGDLLLDPIRREISARTAVFLHSSGGVEVVLGALGSDAGAIGAAAWAMRRLDGTL